MSKWVKTFRNSHRSIHIDIFASMLFFIFIAYKICISLYCMRWRSKKWMVLRSISYIQQTILMLMKCIKTVNYVTFCNINKNLSGFCNNIDKKIDYATKYFAVVFLSQQETFPLSENRDFEIIVKIRWITRSNWYFDHSKINLLLVH